MGEGQLKRIQPDIVEEVNQCEGGSFSEKLRAWRLKEVDQTLTTVQNLTGSDKSLTVDDLKDAIDERLDQLEAGSTDSDNSVNKELTQDDIVNAVEDVITRTHIIQNELNVQ